MDVVNFKVVLKCADDSQEARRFVMPNAVCTSLVSLQQKLQWLFPELVEEQYRIFWKDSEGDEVVIKSDEELVTALLSLDDDVKKIYVDWKDNGRRNAKATQTAGNKEVHHGIVCNECDAAVVGFRFKCLECPNYDLCEKCEIKRLHPMHIMLRIPKELPRRFDGRCMKIGSSMAKAMESARHSGKDHSEKCSRRCAVDKCEKSRTLPVEILFSPNFHRRHCTREWLSPEIENAVYKTFKFFVDAVKDGLTPKTRSEMENAERAENGECSKTENENEKKKEEEEERVEKENEILEGLKKKLSQHVSEISCEAFPAPSAPKMDNTGKQTETTSSGSIYPNVPMDPKIEEALKGMLAMGFSNEGGTLQQMLEEMDGDIAKVLECIDSSLT